MTMMRIATPPLDIEEELEHLLDEWMSSEEAPLSFEDYLASHATAKVLTYMEAVADISDEVQ